MRKFVLIYASLAVLAGCGYYPIEEGNLGSFLEGPAVHEQEQLNDPCHRLPPWKTQAMPECNNSTNTK